MIAYTDKTTGKILVATLASGVTPEQAAMEMRLSPGWRVITPEEAAELQKPTPEEQQAAITAAIQARLDDFARTRGYDNILGATTYAGSANPKFAAEGQYCLEARDATWLAAFKIFAEVGAIPMPTVEDFLAKLPALIWPDEDEGEA